MCVARGLRGNIHGEAKKRGRREDFGHGEIDLWSCLGVGSLTLLPLKPETLNPKT